jgi:thiamine biosynthesis lipoprotein
LLLLASCQARPSAELIQRSQPLFGTFVTIAVYSPDHDKAQRAISDAFAEFHRIDRVLSLHRSDSELSRINSSAAAGPVAVSQELFTVLEKSLEVARATDGSFDPTIRPLVDLWGFIWKEYRLPTDAELASVLPKVNYQHVALDPGARTVRFLRSGISLDFGGIGKGYAVDCAIEKLRARGIANAMVRAGGDIHVIGAPPGKSHWPVQIENPGKKGARQQLRLRDAAISTSGNYENFFVIDGKRYSHILNPRTGLPISDVIACSVIAPTCTESDVYSTAFFVYGPDKTMAKYGDQYAVGFTLSSGEGYRKISNPLLEALSD